MSDAQRRITSIEGFGGSGSDVGYSLKDVRAEWDCGSDEMMSRRFAAVIRPG